MYDKGTLHTQYVYLFYHMTKMHLYVDTRRIFPKNFPFYLSKS